LREGINNVTTQLITQGEVKIRSMEAKDSGSMLELYYVLSGTGMTITLIDLVTEDIKESLALSFVAEVNDQVVGFILARRAYIGTPVVDVSLIQALIINPLHREQDIETRFVEALTERSKSMGIKTIRVILSINDPQMEKFFSRSNFHRAQVMVYDKTL
jgi:predicted N-acetyltransferase YhbS